jgi:3-deoxy-7-phosphoheptulonate synthase
VGKEQKNMIVVMKPGATREQIDHVAARVRQMDLTPHLIQGTERTVVAIVGDERPVSAEILESIPGVEKVMPVLAPYKMASREGRTEPTVVPLLGGRALGGRRVGLIAGPCSVESRERLLEVAHAVKEAGAVALRGGAFKPRTNPYSFQGLAEEGLEYLAAAREATGLAVVTEVMAPEQVPLVARYGDVLQIGARNMQNYDLLRAAGRQSKPVLLKRGLAASVEEWLLAAEYVLAQGNPNVILCERGVRTFEQHTRFTLSLSVVPHLKGVTHLPVVVDPSHGTGRRELVEPLALAAVACGADGLLIEVHHDPESAMLDGAQSLTPEGFARLVASCRRVAEAVGRQL